MNENSFERHINHILPSIISATTSLERHFNRILNRLIMMAETSLERHYNQILTRLIIMAKTRLQRYLHGLIDRPCKLRGGKHTSTERNLNDRVLCDTRPDRFRLLRLRALRVLQVPRLVCRLVIHVLYGTRMAKTMCC